MISDARVRYTDCFDLLKQIEDEMIADLEQLIHELPHKNYTDKLKKCSVK